MRSLQADFSGTATVVVVRLWPLHPGVSSCGHRFYELQSAFDSVVVGMNPVGFSDKVRN